MEADLTPALWNLLRTSQALHAARSIDEQLPVILDSAIELTGAHVCLLVLRSSSGELELVGERYADAVKPKDGAKFSRSIIDEVIATNQPRFILDTSKNPDVKDRQSVQHLGLRAVMAAPLASRTGLFGVLYVHSKAPIASFDEGQREIFLALRGMAAIALDNSRLHSALMIDARTGLYSYSYGMLMLEQEAVLAKRRAQSVSLALIAFSTNRDRATELLRRSIRRVDMALRYSKDQLAVVIPDSSDSTIDELIMKLHKELPTLIIGVATSVQADGPAIERAAETALANALTTGKPQRTTI